MSDLFILYILPWLYQSITIIAFFGYLPQIYNLITSSGRSNDISIPAWIIWAGTWIITFLYAWLVLKDWRVMLVSGVNILGHTCILGLTIFNRYFRYKNQS